MADCDNRLEAVSKGLVLNLPLDDFAKSQFLGNFGKSAVYKTCKSCGMMRTYMYAAVTKDAA